MLHDKTESLFPAGRAARKATIMRVAARLTATSEDAASVRTAAFVLYPTYVPYCLCCSAA